MGGEQASPVALDSHDASRTHDTTCRGFVTADVLVKGLSRGAIATG